MLKGAYQRFRYLPFGFGHCRFRAHPFSPFPVVDDPADPPLGFGVIEFRSRMVARPVGSGGSAVAEPTVLVDGAPAAVGFGFGPIVVPAGRHLVQVQAGASGRSWPVEVPDGGRVRLSSVVSPAGFVGDRRELLRDFYRCFSLGPRAFVPERPRPVRAAVWALAVFAVAVVATGALVLSLFAALVVGVVLFAVPLCRAWVHRFVPYRAARFEPEPVPGGTWRIVDPGDRSAVSAPAGTGVLRVHVVFVHEAVGAERLEPVAKSRPRPGAVGAQAVPGSEGRGPHPGARSSEVLGEELSGVGRWAVSEWRALQREMRWDRDYRRRRLEARRRAWPPPPWVDPPRVVLDGVDLPAVWGLNEYRLAEGRYESFEVALPPPPGRLVNGGTLKLSPLSKLGFELDLRPGAPVVVEVYARISSKLQADGLRVEEYSGHLWTSPNSGSPR